MIIRPYQDSDRAQVVSIWRASKRKAFPYVEVQQQYTHAQDDHYFRSVIARNCEVWLAEDDGQIVGMMALEGDLIDQLFVAPSAQGQGAGTALLNKAAELSPERLRAYTFQKNHAARQFFEKHGFLIVGASLSPPPENEPDLEYCRQPGGWRTRMKPGKIRTIVVCVILHNGRIFVFEARDEVKKQTFYRPLGGAIEFGETSEQAIRREMREEINAELANLRRVGTLENLFTLNGQPGHEIVLVYAADFADRTLYEQDEVVGLEDNGETFKALWKALDDFQDPQTPLYPDGLHELIREIA
ncbi:MAG: GNAT family N-acetyltransferase [Candidatus Promineifilaceae bacterium]|nr:GNAT family N-acetyltransferase [Candidatus Promineifilaceae bacterium]